MSGAWLARMSNGTDAVAATKALPKTLVGKVLRRTLREEELAKGKP